MFRSMEPIYARHAYLHALEDLEHSLLEMGTRAEQMVSMAVDALVELNTEESMRVLNADDEVDDRDLVIEDQCLQMLALQQPIGSDLRVIGAIMKIITDIERVGDLAVDIAKCAMKIDKELSTTTYVDIPRMAGIARKMFRDALEAFVKRDMDLVQAIGRADDEVDDLYRELRAQIHEHMRTTPDDVVASSWLLLAIHHLERIADHAVNIAERVGFMVTGKMEQFSAVRRGT